jgi:aspartyl-tRNA(Asn)/glutamyl-tRNA(Gln) amidotransferase subunit C
MANSKKISREQIESLAKLARLEFSVEELEELESSLNQIISYMSKLNELDLRQIEPMTRVDETVKTLRNDRVKSGTSKTLVFKNAPAEKDGFFTIPKTVK